MTEAERQRIIRQKLCRLADPGPASLPTGVAAVDALLGTGGWPRGYVVEVYGPEACGKSALALRSVAETMRHGGNAAYLDVDATFDPAQAERAGVVLEKLILARPRWSEQALEMARSLAASGAVDLIVIDSAAALVPRLELESSLESVAPGLQSAVLTRGLRRLASAARRSGACLLFLNQLRSTGAWDGEETTACGKAFKAYAAVRAELRPVGVGRARLRIVRNRLGAAGEAEFDIRWGGDTSAPPLQEACQ